LKSDGSVTEFSLSGKSEKKPGDDKMPWD